MSGLGYRPNPLAKVRQAIDLETRIKSLGYLQSVLPRSGDQPKGTNLVGLAPRHKGYFWPILEERQEICFPYTQTQGAIHIQELLGSLGAGTVLPSDSYAAYTRFQKETEGRIHAQCWSHSRREFMKAEAHEPERMTEALEQIRAFYRIEEEIRDQNLTGEAKREYRYLHTRPRVAQFFAWVERQLADAALLPSNPFTKACQQPPIWRHSGSP